MGMGSCVYNRPEHNRVAEVLNRLNGGLLRSLGCYFAGGTAIVLQYGEYRLSRDIDFLCSDVSCFSALRKQVFKEGLSSLFRAPQEFVRPARTDKYAIRSLVDLQDGEAPLKLEFIAEGYLGGLDQDGQISGVPTLCLRDLISSKLMANADRGLDPMNGSRDFIDLAMISYNNGGLIPESFARTEKVYGEQIIQRLCDVSQVLTRKDHFKFCAESLSMDDRAISVLEDLLDSGDPVESLKTGGWNIPSKKLS